MKKSVILLILFMCVFVGKLGAYMFGNESCQAFQLSCNGGSGLISSNSIGSLIIEGGRNFFKSNSEVCFFLSLVEISELTGPDFKALQTAINSTINDMEKAKTAYYQLKSLAANTPYNQEVILQLMQFDYLKYQNENGLLSEIFGKVEKFLSRGDVRGVYNEFYSNTLQLLKILYTVKKDIDSNVLPNISILWRLSQKFSEVKLFGQYVTEVFFGIK